MSKKKVSAETVKHFGCGNFHVPKAVPCDLAKNVPRVFYFDPKDGAVYDEQQNKIGTANMIEIEGSTKPVLKITEKYGTE